MSKVFGQTQPAAARRFNAAVTCDPGSVGPNVVARVYKFSL